MSTISSLERRGYQLQDKIGKGSFSVVYRATFQKEKQKSENLACKRVSKSSNFFVEKFFQRELEVLQKFSHQNIIAIHSILESKTEVFIFMRWAENGTLFEYIRKNNEPISEPHCNLWFFQMVSAIKYMHSLQYAHRDIKCDNMLITKNLNIKVGDFGFARSFDRKVNVLSSTFCGSELYAAPEIHMSVPYDPMKGDMWSLGIVLFVMLHRTAPFEFGNFKRSLTCMRDKKYAIKKGLSVHCDDMIQSLLEPDPILRPDIEEVYAKHWLRDRALKEYMQSLDIQRLIN